MVLLVLTNCSHQPSFYSLCQIIGHSSLDHAIWDLLPNMEKNSKILTLCKAHFIVCLVRQGLYLGCNSGCDCDEKDKWVWVHVLLPLSLLRRLLRDVRPTWGGVYTAYTPTHLGHLNSTLQSVLCITQLLSSGLKFLDVQD